MSAKPRNPSPVILVTGAAGGIGSEIVASLSGAGAQVVAFDSDRVGLQRLEEFNGVTGIVVNLADPVSIEQAVIEAVEAFGAPDGLVSAAGVNSRVDFLELPLAEWDRVMRINLTGTFLIGQQVAREMVKAGREGSIVNIASTSARVIRRPDISSYAVSKAGVESLTQVMAVSLAEHGIRVNAVSPGPVETEMTSARRETPEGTRELLRGVLRGRLGRPSDVASAVSFLLSADSDFMTGSTMVVDGGVLVGCANYITEEI